jgi:hypothetical protein
MPEVEVGKKGGESGGVDRLPGHQAERVDRSVRRYLGVD